MKQGYQIMEEVVFLVTESEEGGYTARALGVDIFTEADTLPELRTNIKDAVMCHFDDPKRPALIRLHFVKEEYLTV